MLCRPKTDTHFKGITGPFEKENLLLALQACDRFGTAIDGGAHIGSWTQYLSGKFDHVLAFEPYKDNYDCLVKNTKGLDNVMLYNKALGDNEKRMAMYFPDDAGNSGAGCVTEGDDFDVITIDSLGLDALDFLKLDIEGYEPHAISGAMNTIHEFKPVVLVEQKELTARYGLDYKLAGKILESIGYQLFAHIRRDYIYKWSTSAV